MTARGRDLALVVVLGIGFGGCRSETKRASDAEQSNATKEAAPALSAVTPSPKPPPAQAQDETKEPKLGFTVRIGSTELHLSEGDQLPAKGTFTDPSVSVTVDPERIFSHAGLSFAYPRSFTFEADLSAAHSHSWTLSGNDVKIMIFRFSTELSVDTFAKELAEGFGPKSTTSPISIQLGSEKYSGLRIRAALASYELTQDVFALPSVNGKGRFLVLQDDGSGNKPESEPTRALLSKTFRVTE